MPSPWWPRLFPFPGPSRRRAPSRPSLRPRAEALEDRLAPANFTVQNLNDSGAGSLRDALTRADADSEITFTTASGALLTGTINLQSALPDVTGNITLFGPGADLLTVQRSTAAGTPNFGIFTIDAGATGNIIGLTIQNGNAPDGGGINNQGTLFLLDAAVTGNTASDLGGGVLNGIFPPPMGSQPDLVVMNSTISGNTDSNGEGAGGIDSEAGSLSVTNSTISGNQALNSHSAGGIGVYGGLAFISNSTIANNTESDPSNMLAISAGGLDASGRSVTLFDTIVAGNHSTTGNDDVQGKVATLGHNLIGSGTGATGFDTTKGDKVGTAAMLGTLQNNGGPTQTMAPGSGSPAIGQGDVSNAPPTDQRGDVRVVNNQIDVGAFQSQSPVLVVSGTAVSTLPVAPPAGQSVTLSAHVGTVVRHATSSSPSGNVNFSVDGKPAGSASLSGGTAQLTLPNGLSAGQHTIRADFPTDGTFTSSFGTFMVNVGSGMPGSSGSSPGSNSGGAPPSQPVPPILLPPPPPPRHHPRPAPHQPPHLSKAEEALLKRLALDLFVMPNLDTPLGMQALQDEFEFYQDVAVNLSKSSPRELAKRLAEETELALDGFVYSDPMSVNYRNQGVANQILALERALLLPPG